MPLTNSLKVVDPIAKITGSVTIDPIVKIILVEVVKGNLLVVILIKEDLVLDFK